MDRAAASPDSRANVLADTGHNADTQPPLRPLAPNPTCSASSTTTDNDGSSPSK